MVLISHTPIINVNASLRLLHSASDTGTVKQSYGNLDTEIEANGCLEFCDKPKPWHCKAHFADNWFDWFIKSYDNFRTLHSDAIINTTKTFTKL